MHACGLTRRMPNSLAECGSCLTHSAASTVCTPLRVSTTALAILRPAALPASLHCKFGPCDPCAPHRMPSRPPAPHCTCPCRKAQPPHPAAPHPQRTAIASAAMSSAHAAITASPWCGDDAASSQKGGIQRNPRPSPAQPAPAQRHASQHETALNLNEG